MRCRSVGDGSSSALLRGADEAVQRQLGERAPDVARARPPAPAPPSARRRRPRPSPRAAPAPSPAACQPRADVVGARARCRARSSSTMASGIAARALGHARRQRQIGSSAIGSSGGRRTTSTSTSSTSAPRRRRQHRRRARLRDQLAEDAAATARRSDRRPRTPASPRRGAAMSSAAATHSRRRTSSGSFEAAPPKPNSSPSPVRSCGCSRGRPIQLLARRPLRQRRAAASARAGSDTTASSRPTDRRRRRPTLRKRPSSRATHASTIGALADARLTDERRAPRASSPSRRSSTSSRPTSGSGSARRARLDGPVTAACTVANEPVGRRTAPHSGQKRAVPGSGVPHCLQRSPDMPRTAASSAAFISAAERKRFSRVLVERLQAHRLERARNRQIGPALRRRLRQRVEVRHQHVDERPVAGEGPRAGHRLVEHDAGGVDVGARVELLAADLLRAHVVGRAADRAARGQVARRPRRAAWRCRSRAP